MKSVLKGVIRLAGIAWLFVFWLAGEFCARVLKVPLPGNVIGLIMLFAALHLKWVRLQWLERTAQFLISHLMLFFAPFVVGTIAFYPILLENWLAAGLAISVGTLCVLAAAGAAARLLSANRKKEGSGRADS
jgi:holin-like protein